MRALELEVYKLVNWAEEHKDHQHHNGVLNELDGVMDRRHSLQARQEFGRAQPSEQKSQKHQPSDQVGVLTHVHHKQR